MHQTATFKKTYLFKVVLFTQSWVELCGVGGILLLSMGSCRHTQGKEDYRAGEVRESLHRAVYPHIVQSSDAATQKAVGLAETKPASKTPPAKRWAGRQLV